MNLAVTRSIAVAVGSLLLMAQTALAQRASPRGRISGVVFDSLVSNAPLSGAEVTVDGTDRSALTDAKGRFVIEGVAAGRAVLRFYHVSLDSLGFGAAPVAVVIPDSGVVIAALTTPSPAHLRASVCPGPQPPATGVILGRIRDVDDHAPIPNDTVTASWTVWTIGKSGMVSQDSRSFAESNANGAFALCGVPNDVPVIVRAAGGGHVSGLVNVDLAHRLFVVRDFALSFADSASSTRVLARQDSALLRGDSIQGLGSATVTGVVRGEGGRVVDQAQIGVFGFPLSTRSGSGGTYALTRLPSGTQTVDVRAVGFAPKRLTVDLKTGERRTLDVTLDRATAQELAPVNIVGRGAIVDRTGFEDRRKSGFGRYITEEDIKRRGVFETTQALWNVLGTRVVWNGHDNVVMFTRPFGSGRGTPVDQGKGVMQAGSFNNLCSPAYWIDGFAMPPPIERFGDNEDDTNSLVRPRDIRGIEVYVDPSSVPPRYRRPDVQCGVVLIWTKPPPPKQLKQPKP